MHVVWCTQKIDLDDDLLGIYVEWIRRLASLVDRVTVIALCVGRHDLPENVRVVSLGKERGVPKLVYLAGFYRALVRDCRGADVLVSHMSTVWAILAWPVYAVLRRPIVLWYAHYLVSWHVRLAVMMSRIVLTSVPEACAVKSSKVVAVGQGIDVSRFSPRPHATHEGFRVLSLGRVSSVKKVKEIVLACSALRANGADVRLEVYGEPATDADKQYFVAVHDAASDSGIEGGIAFMGKVPNRETPGVYATADLFVNLTRTGSFDKTILEAMSCGVPVLVANATYTSILPPEARHLLLDDTDPETVAGGIGRVMAMGESGRELLGSRLREIVISDHNLETQMARIVIGLKSCTR